MKDINIKIEELDYTKPIKYYSELYGISLNALRNRFKKLNVYNLFIFTKDNTSKIKSQLLKNEYLKTPKKCLNCNVDILYKNKNNLYCSNKCASIHTQINGGHHKCNDEEKKKLSLWAIKNNVIKFINVNGIRPAAELIKKICPTCNIEFETFPSQKHQICCSRKCSTIWMNKTGYLKGKSGGYRKNSGRGKQGWYKGYFCQSSWELAWVIYQLDHKLKFKRNTQGFEYKFENKKYKFYPDFVLDNGEYVEVKGYMTDKNKSKFLHFPHTLTVIGKNDIKPYIEYVEKKYGKNYLNLYEKK